MKIRNKRPDIYCALNVITVAWFLMRGALAEAHDFSGWDALLKKHISPAALAGVNLNVVAYGKLKDDPQFKKLVDGLGNASPGNSKAQQLAFWINTYNILAVKVVADHYPIKSIKAVGSLLRPVWKHSAAVVAGKERSLHEIEHEILRKMNEPRIHMAIVCASISCPDLRPEAYAPEGLESQLDEQTKAFVQNPGKGMKIDAPNQKIYLSSIFKWFAGDFEGRGGVLTFISNYVSPADRQFLNKNAVKISYLDYNWELNGS